METYLKEAIEAVADTTASVEDATDTAKLVKNRSVLLHELANEKLIRIATKDLINVSVVAHSVVSCANEAEDNLKQANSQLNRMFSAMAQFVAATDLGDIQVQGQRMKDFNEANDRLIDLVSLVEQYVKQTVKSKMDFDAVFPKLSARKP